MLLGMFGGGFGGEGAARRPRSSMKKSQGKPRKIASSSMRKTKAPMKKAASGVHDPVQGLKSRICRKLTLTKVEK